MIVKLTKSQTETLKSMDQYWQEISKREPNQAHRIAHDELSQLLSVIKSIDILLIVGEYANNYKAE